MTNAFADLTLIRGLTFFAKKFFQRKNETCWPHVPIITFSYNLLNLEWLELLDTNADLFVLVQGGQFLGDLTLDPIDHVLGLMLGKGGLDSNLKIISHILAWKKKFFNFLIRFF